METNPAAERALAQRMLKARNGLVCAAGHLPLAFSDRSCCQEQFVDA